MLAPVLRGMSDVQDFHGVVLHPVGDYMRQARLQRLAGALLASRWSHPRKLLELAYALAKLYDRGPGQLRILFSQIVVDGF